MDPTIPESSRPKRRCIDWRKTEPLTEKELQEMANKLIKGSDDDPLVK